jgi:hypothetical protein
VIVSGANPAARVDVEAVLLCDVLADGTVAATVLLEPIYDATSGARIGTRTVDPVTGADYAVTGELQACPPPEACSCETVLLCDVTTVTTPGETPERITNGTFPADASGWTLTGGARYVPSSSPDGSVGFLDLSADNNPAGSAEQTVTVTPGLTYNLSARIGIWGTGGTTPQSVLVEVLDGSGAVLYSQVVAPVEISGGPQWPADGVVGPVPIVATDTEMTVRFTDQVGGDFIDSLVDDVSLLGPGVPGTSETGAVPFLRTLCRTCTGTATVTDTTLDGATTYAVQGEVGVCGPTGEETAPPLVLGQVCYDDGTGTVRTAAAVRCAGCDDATVTYLDVTTGEEVTAPTVVDCPPVEECSCETLLLCDTPPSGELPTADATVSVTATTPGSGAPGPGSIMGAPFNAPLTDSQAVWDGSSAVLPASVDNGHTYVTGLVDLAPDCGALDPAGSTVLNLGVRIHNDGAGAACGLWGRFTVWVNGVDVIGAPASHLGTLGGGTGLAPGATITPTRTATVSNADLLAGDVYVELNVQTGADTTPDGGGCTPNDPGVGQAFTVDQFTITAEPVAVTGCLAPEGGEPVPFLRTLCRSCTGTPTVTDTLLDGTTAYDVQGEVGVCGPTSEGCASPTPVTSVGLCLADGTPVAVTIVRDCDGAVTSEGWLNLVTGAWSAGAVPAGTVACGDSRSIQVSGTFCDVLPDGTVAGLVLVEYSYDDAGAISSVRLVDAVTGDTYTPTGTVTTCPTGTEQPEQDAVILCDVQADGTSVQFVRDYRRDEAGAITGHTDYLLDGTPYPAPTGTVGVCQPQACQDCESLLLCDYGADNPATITGLGVSSGTLSNGVAWSVRGNTQTGTPSKVNNADGAWFGKPESFPNIQVSPYNFTFSRPSVVEFSVYMGNIASPAEANDNCTQLPPGVEPVFLPEGWVFNPVTSQVCVTTDQVDNNCANLDNPTVAVSARFRTSGPVTSLTTLYLGPRISRCSSFQTAWVGALEVIPTGQFLRRICRTCAGAVATVTDTLLDGTTSYAPVGPVGACQPSETAGASCTTVQLTQLCDVASAPPPPIPIPASGFTMTGNVFNSGGTFVFSQGNVPVTGVVEHTVSGLIPGFSYEVLFDSGWNGGGLPLGTRDAMYRAEVLDGATVLTSRDTNVSNGATASGPLTADTPLAFTAPDSGTVNVRFTDLTVGDGSGRDLLLRPLTVQTDDPIVTTTPFLRAISYYCDGQPAGSTDWELDGTTPYILGGVAETCPTSSDGTDSTDGTDYETVLLCNVTEGEAQTYTPTSTAVLPPVASTEPPISSTVAGFMIDPTPAFSPGGSVVVPTWGTDPGGFRINAISGRVTSTGPTPCGTPGDVRVTVTLRAMNSGNANDVGNPEAQLTLRNGSTVLDSASVAQTNPGVQQTFEVEAVVPWADLIAGSVTWYWWARVYQEPNIHKSFLIDEYAVTIEDAVPIPGCGEGSVVPFVRHYVPDTEAGTASFFDTTLDGATYAPVGEVTTCAGSGSGGAGADVETWPLCVVDNTTGNVLQHVRAEQVYDATGTATGLPRIVDAVTGGPVSVPGGASIAVCPSSTTPGSAETLLLCDVTEVTTPGETPERITNGHFAANLDGWTIIGGAAYVPTGGPDGQVGVLDFSQNNQGAGTAEQTATVTPGLTYNLSARIGIWSTGGTTPQSVLVEVLDGSGAVLHSEIVAPAAVSGGPLWPADGVVGPVPIVATDNEMTVRFTDQVGGDFIDALLDDVSLLGPGVPGTTEGQAVPFLRHYTVDPDTEAVSYFDTTLDGAAYAPQGEVTQCPGGSVAGDDDGTSAVVSTGARSVTGTTPVDLAGEFPGLQSVTLLVSAGSVLATLTNGAAVPIPAGANVTWSVTRDGDGSLDAASFAGADAGTTYLLLFTYTA